MQREKRSARREKLSAESVRAEMQASVRWLALPGLPGEGVKACIRRVAIKADLNCSIVKRLWYLEYKRIPTDVSDAVRRAVERNERIQSDEWETIKKRYWALTHQSNDTEFYSGRLDEGRPQTDGLD